MSSTRRATRALMAVSAFLRVPWAISLALKATLSSNKVRPPSRGAVQAKATFPSMSRRTTRPTHFCRLLKTGAVSRSRAASAINSARREASCDEAVLLKTAEACGTGGSQSTSKSVAGTLVADREVLGREAWTARAEAHQTRVRALTGGSVHHDQNDPIFNFLFEYYHFKPRMLLQWTPGFDVELLDADPSMKGCPLPQKAWEPRPGGGGRYNPFRLDVKRRNTVQWVRDFLAATSTRAPVFHCFGLHEWAMLYRPSGAAKDSRSVHQSLPLRVSQEEINAMVEGKGGLMGCTHFDAFRFFAAEARPLNSIQLERRNQQASDQPGCVHANMDLFKWALRLWPLLPSEKMVDALELAVSCRMLDMRASPYDLTAYGNVPNSAVGKGGGNMGGLHPESWDPTPVRIEAEDGRKEYQQAQWELYHRSMPVRRSLLSHIDRLLEVWRV